MAKNKLLLFFILSILLVSTVQALIPAHHVQIAQEALENTQGSPITQDIVPFMDYYAMGTQISDIHVVYYFAIEQEPDDNFFKKLFNLFTFNIGAPYRSSHSVSACQRGVEISSNPKEYATAMGLCSHMIADEVSHNDIVPTTIRKTSLWNGLIHSPTEINQQNMFTNQQTKIYSQQVLDLAYEMTPFLEKTFSGTDSDINIPALVDFFVTQMQEDPTGNYRLGFQSFFALPSYVYWMLLIILLSSLFLVALTIRKIREGQRSISTIVTMFVGLALFGLTATAIYGLLRGNVWQIWEKLSQFIFSPAMYFIAGFLLIVGVTIVFKFFASQEKSRDFPNLFGALFLITISFILFTFPTGLDIGNEQALHDKAVDHTENLLTQGVTYVRTVQDPVGFVALREADMKGANNRRFVMGLLITLLALMIFFTFRRNRK